MQELINQEVYRLRYACDTFKLLFTTSAEHIEVLNAAGPEFFGMAERLMWDDVILRVCRLTDRVIPGSQKSVTLAQLLSATGWEATDGPRWAEFSDKLCKVDVACSACRKHRNKRISHLDLRWASKALTLPNTGLKSLNCAVEAIENFAAEMYGEIHADSSISFEILNNDWGVKHLLRRLMNRPSQRLPNALVTVRYTPGSPAAKLECPFCHATETISFYPQSVPVSWQRVRWHFDKCYGVVGHETLTVRAVDISGVNPSLDAALDLTTPTNKTP